MLRTIGAIVLLLILPCLFTSSSPSLYPATNCSLSITIVSGSISCSRLTQSNDTVQQLQCSDLQSALVAAAQLGSDYFTPDSSEGLNTSSCVSIAVPVGVHFITEPVHFNDANLFLFADVGGGETEDVATIHCNYTEDVDESRIFDLDYSYIDYTFYFNRSEAMSFQKLKFIGCPYPIRLDTIAAIEVYNSTFQEFTEAVFDIYNSAEVSITDSTFVNNSGTGISRFSFRANTGAVAVGYNNIPNKFTRVSLEVLRCNFTNNSATAERRVRSTNSAFFSQVFSGRGGGIGVFYNESYYNITARISDCHFERNYARSFGGGVFLVFFGEGTQNIVTLERNTFVNNFAVLGGGAILNTFFSNGVIGRPHSTIITDCLLSGNVGQSGGALFLYQAYQLFGYIRCERCNFTDNAGVDSRDEYGAAVGIYLINQFDSRESAPRHEFIDCIFEQNTGNNGIVTVAYAPLAFIGSNKFINNKGTDALRIIGSLVDFHGEILFINTTDFNAVAMHLLSFGQARVFSGLEMLFWGNRGSFGSSILVDSQTAAAAFSQIAFNPQCFIIREDTSRPPGQWNDVSVSFQRNKAVLGSSLFISRLETCSWISPTAEPAFNNTYVFDWPIWEYDNSSINTGYVDSYDSEHSVVTTIYTFGTANQSVTAWPGQQFLIELTGWDQFSQPTTANARFTFMTELEEVAVHFNPQLVVIDAAGNTTLIRDFKTTYSISSGAALTLNGSLGTVVIDDPIINVAVAPASFTLYPLPCPAGYALVSTGLQQRGLECQCEQNNNRIINCEDDQDTVVVEEGYWGAAIFANSSHRYDLFLYPCPPGYCKCSQNTSLGISSCAFTYTNSDPDAQCVCHRQGTLCGECRGGRGVSAILNSCVSCHNAQGLLILALIVAVSITFVVLVLADFPLPDWVYPFLFYIHVVPSVAIYFPESFIKGGKFLHFISSALSFYFVYDFCLYSNMSPLVSYFIRYLPFLVAVLLFPAVFMTRLMKRRSLILKHHGVWWIILLLYAHLVHTSMSILECPILPNHSFPRWFVDGNIECFTGGHIPLSLLAIAVLVLTVILVPLIGLISTKRILIKHRHFVSLKYYFEHPVTLIYKENWRWWSAIDLARRFLFILFVIPFPRNSVPSLLVMCIVFCIYGLVQPYKSRVTNIIEMMVQVTFIILLTLESTSFLRDIYNVFPLPQVRVGNSANVTMDVCTDGRSGVSVITSILLPFYYLPLLALIAVATVKLSIHIWSWNRSVRQRSVLRRATTVHHAANAVTTTEIELSYELMDNSVQDTAL